MKVYCSNCRWFKLTGCSQFYADRCDHPDNMKDTYSKKRIERKFNPQLINRNNNCTWFEKKISIWKRIKSGITNRRET